MKKCYINEIMKWARILKQQFLRIVCLACLVLDNKKNKKML